MPWTGGSPAASPSGIPSGAAPTFDSGPGGATSGSGGPGETVTQAGGGSFSADFTSPQDALASLQQAPAKAGDVLGGLAAAIGQSPIGAVAKGIADLPVVGGALQAVGNIPGGIAAGVGGVIGHTADAIGGALEKVSNPFTSTNDLQHQFDAIPDGVEKQAAEAQIAANPDDKEHIMFQAASAYAQTDAGMAAQVGPYSEQGSSNLNPTYSVTATTLADTLGQMFGAIGNLAKPLERVAAGVQHGGLDRMDSIDAVVNGQAVFAGALGGDTGIAGSGIGPNVFSGGSPTQLSPAEQMAYTYWKGGQWSKNQALDFLTAAGEGAAHDTGLQLAGHIALDPTTWGSLGASALAKLGVVGLDLVSAASAASDAAEAAGVGAKAAEVAGTIAAEGDAATKAAEGGVKISEAFDAGAASKAAKLKEQVNVLAKIGRNQEVSDVVRWLGEHVYSNLTVEDTTARSVLGVAAQATRAVVDPLNAIGGLLQKSQAFVDLGSSVVGKAYVAAFGDGPAAKMMSDLVEAAGGLGSKEGTQMRDLLQQTLGDTGANVFRRVTARLNRDTMLATGNAEVLRASTPTADIEKIIGSQQKGIIQAVTSSALNDQAHVLTAADKENLFSRMENFLGPAPEGFDTWADVGAHWTGEQLSLMHGLTFQHAESTLENLIQELKPGVDAATWATLRRVIHINSRTLDIVSAKDLLAGIAKTATGKTGLADRLALIEAAQKQFPRLADYAVDGSSKSIEQFVKKLTGDVAAGNLPNVLREKELAALGPELVDHQASVEGAWKLAIRPEDSQLYGLRTDLKGNLVAGWDVYVDRVTGSAPFQGALTLQHNIAGMPIVGKYLAGATDAIQTGASTLGRHIDQSIIEANVRNRFIQIAHDEHGLTPEESSNVLDAIMERAQMGHQSTRSMTAEDIWKAMEPALPADVLHGSRLAEDGEAAMAALGKRSSLNLVLKAWQGDMRYVGISQELTGAAKVLFGKSGENFAGQISEGLWRSMKFTYNAAFQVQQKAEMIVFSTLRGEHTAFGASMTADDKAWKSILDNMAGTSINRVAATIGHGESEFGGIETLAQSLDGAVPAAQKSLLKKITGLSWNSGGSKEVAYLRNVAGRMGRDLKQGYESVDPGFWARDAAQRSAVLGRRISDDQHALALLTEQGFGADVKVPSTLIPGAEKGLMDNARVQQAMMSARDVGQLHHINVDEIMAKANIPFRNESVGLNHINSDASLRQALASGDVPWSKVSEHLSAMGYSPENIAAVQRAVKFNWGDYWQSVASEYKLSAKESVDMQSMARAAAKSRGMEPGEFMSQHFAPRVGGELTAKEVKAHLAILRAGPDLQPENLINQLADAFGQHLDPSALRQLEEHYAARGSGSLAQSIAARVEQPRVFEPAPEGFTDNPYAVAPGQTFSPELHRDGLFHISTNSGGEGFGSKGDEINQARVSTLQDRARTQTYLDRLRITAEAAHGASTEHIMDAFEAAYTRSFAGDAGAAAAMEKATTVPLADWETTFLTPEDKYQLVQRLDAGLSGPGVSLQDRVVKLNASFDDAAKMDPAKFEVKSYAVRPGTGLVGQDSASGELTFDRADMHQTGTARDAREPVPVAARVEPGIEGTMQEFSKWTKSVMREGMFAGSGGKSTLSPELNDLFTRISGIPTKAATPFNRDEAVLQSLTGQIVGKSEQDAFKLAYFQRDRTMFERSLNHPIFGIYPASYMWGKVAPEMIRFMAQTPFGAETGALAYAANDARAAVAAQYEWDPAFRAKMDGLGASPALFFLGYLLPGVPWDVNASAPAWMRNVAGQANLNQKLIDAGQDPKPLNFISADTKSVLGSEFAYMNPLRTPAMAAKAVTGVQNVIENKKPGFDQYSDVPPPPSTPGQKPAANAPGGLGPTLDDAITALQGFLSGQ